MLTKDNVCSQKVNVIDVPLQRFHSIGSDIYKPEHIRVGRTDILRWLA